MIIFNIYNASNDLFVNLFIVLLICSYIAVINILINYIIHTHTHTYIYILFNKLHFFNETNLQLTKFSIINPSQMFLQNFKIIFY